MHPNFRSDRSTIFLATHLQVTLMLENCLHLLALILTESWIPTLETLHLSQVSESLQAK